MPAGLAIILCMLGLSVCFDIVLRIFDVHVSSWNGTLRANSPEKDKEQEKDVLDPPSPPTAR